MFNLLPYRWYFWVFFNFPCVQSQLIQRSTFLRTRVVKYQINSHRREISWLTKPILSTYPGNLKSVKYVRTMCLILQVHGQTQLKPGLWHLQADAELYWWKAELTEMKGILHPLRSQFHIASHLEQRAKAQSISEAHWKSQARFSLVLYNYWK